MSGTGAVALDADVAVARPGGFTLAARVSAAPGQVVAVMGPSGAGKSTLLAAIAGLTPLDAGRVTLGGEVLSDPARQVAPARRGTVLLGQDPRLFPHLSARDNVAFGPRAHGVPSRTARTAAEEWLARVGLPGLGDRRPAELSGGQQQRVAIARALAASPRLVLLDEPLTSLDPVTADGIRTLLAERLRGVTCVVVTHDAVDAVALAARLVVLEAGRVTQSGAVREVLAAPATGFAASVAGVNRVVGVSRGGACVVAAARIAGDRGADVPEGQPVAAVFRSADVRIERAADARVEISGEPGVGGAGDARAGVGADADAAAAASTWGARVARLEPTIGGVRVHTEPGAVAADLAIGQAADLALRAGVEVRLSVPVAAVRLLPA